MYKLVVSFAISLFLTGCFQFPGVYKQDIAQGNIISPQMLSQLKPGMSKPQVTYVLGSPLTIDALNSEHWIYLSRKTNGGEAIEQPQQLSLHFANDRLIRIEHSND